MTGKVKSAKSIRRRKVDGRKVDGRKWWGAGDQVRGDSARHRLPQAETRPASGHPSTHSHPSGPPSTLSHPSGHPSTLSHHVADTLSHPRKAYARQIARPMLSAYRAVGGGRSPRWCGGRERSAERSAPDGGQGALKPTARLNPKPQTLNPRMCSRRRRARARPSPRATDGSGRSMPLSRSDPTLPTRHLSERAEDLCVGRWGAPPRGRGLCSRCLCRWEEGRLSRGGLWEGQWLQASTAGQGQWLQ
ncbi:hypothetical protein T484DRAFT_3286393 [Baffinella frigidus]|nr:hypothetical protein T484DRAFT_3286393 [Cryptophyta sp. CCMP2293]